MARWDYSAASFPDTVSADEDSLDEEEEEMLADISVEDDEVSSLSGVPSSSLSLKRAHLLHAANASSMDYSGDEVDPPSHGEPS